MYSYYSGGTAAVVLMFVAFIAAIVLTVKIYREYVQGLGETKIDLKDKAQLASFLRFDTLLIDKILKALYIFSALCCAFFPAATCLAMLFVSFGAFLGSLIGGLIAVVIGEIVCRLVYECMMLGVIVARNTSDIKRKLYGEPAGPTPAPLPAAPTAPVAPVAPTAPVAPAAPVVVAPIATPIAAPAPEPAPAPAPEPEPAPAPEPEPAPAPEPEVELFCTECGEELPAGSKFCTNCGTKVE